MPATLSYTIPYPLPAALHPDAVVAALHTYEPLITPNPFMVSYRRRPVELAEIVDDPFFREDGARLAAFEVVDRIVLVPGIASKQVTIPCVMQSFEGGVRCRSLASGGVRVWSTWRVRPRSASPPSPLSSRSATSKTSKTASPRSSTHRSRRSPPPPSSTPARQDSKYDSEGSSIASASPPGDWELVEEARVECSSLVKPFVAKSFVSAHREILRRMVAEMMRLAGEGEPYRYG